MNYSLLTDQIKRLQYSILLIEIVISMIKKGVNVSCKPCNYSKKMYKSKEKLICI